jgi:hypothetical protein
MRFFYETLVSDCYGSLAASHEDWQFLFTYETNLHNKLSLRSLKGERARPRSPRVQRIVQNGIDVILTPTLYHKELSAPRPAHPYA